MHICRPDPERIALVFFGGENITVHEDRIMIDKSETNSFMLLYKNHQFVYR